VNFEYEKISAQYSDESDADYEARLESERIRQEQLDADPDAHIALANATAEYLHEKRMRPPDPPMDFISTYAAWADVVELPRAVHEAVALQLVASVLNRAEVWIDRGAFQLSMDCWLAVIAPSGGGKNTAMNPVWQVLREAGVTDLIDSTDWGSKEKLYEVLSGVDPAAPAAPPVVSRFYAWTEFSQYLQKFNSPAFAEAKSWFVDLYDEFRPPAAKGYRTVDDITFTIAPRTNILAFSTPVWFFDNLKSEDSKSGFLQRWIIVKAAGSDRDIAEPHQRSERVARKLGQFIAELSKTPTGRRATFFDGFSEPGEAPASRCPFNVWYNETKPRWKSAHPLGETFFKRHQNHVLKLAVCYQASMYLNVAVTSDAWERAVAKARELEAMLFDDFRTDMTSSGKALVDIEEEILRAGPKGMPRTSFINYAKNIRGYIEIEHTLVNMEHVFYVAGERIHRTGPVPTLMVHKNYVNAAPGAYTILDPQEVWAPRRR
jgi:hypothetical protein